MELHSPAIFEGTWTDARDKAMDTLEPVFVPLTPFTDDRGWSVMNMLTGAMSEQGQLNFSVQLPGAIKAWHRHQRQTDFWCCVSGHIKAGIHRESDEKTWLWVFGEKRLGVLVIPPSLWHGATSVGPAPAGLLYYVTHRYDPAQPDEERRAYDSIAGFPWHTRHG